jgi:hypothetical protein
MSRNTVGRVREISDVEVPVRSPATNEFFHR